VGCFIGDLHTLGSAVHTVNGSLIVLNADINADGSMLRLYLPSTSICALFDNEQDCHAQPDCVFCTPTASDYDDDDDDVSKQAFCYASVGGLPAG